MKAVECFKEVDKVMKKMKKIEERWIIIEEPTNKLYGIAINICNDPELRISYIDTVNYSGGDFKIGRKSYKFHKSNDGVYINVANVDKLVAGIKQLMEMDV